MHVTELELSPAALACLRAVGIVEVDQLASHTGNELIARGIGAVELYEVVCRLNERGRSLPPRPGLKAKGRVPQRREREVLRLRLVEGLTLQEIGERFGIGDERVRQLLNRNFGLTGKVPTVQARRWAATERRRSEAIAKRRRRPLSARPSRRGARHLSVIRDRERGPCDGPPLDAA